MEATTGDEDLGGLTPEELQQGQEAALALEDMMALSAQTLLQAEVDALYLPVRTLGQGRYGRVLLVTHRQKGTCGLCSLPAVCPPVPLPGPGPGPSPAFSLGLSAALGPTYALSLSVDSKTVPSISHTCFLWVTRRSPQLRVGYRGALSPTQWHLSATSWLLLPHGAPHHLQERDQGA